MTVEDTLFIDLSSQVAVDNQGSLTMVRTRITNSKAGPAGVAVGRASLLKNDDGADATLREATSERTDDGPAIANRGILSLADSTLVEGTSMGNPSGLWIISGSASVVNTTISNNTGGIGAGIWCDGGPGTSLQLQNVTITGNSVSNGLGAGLLQSGGCAVRASGTTITGNTPQDCGLNDPIVDESGNSDSDSTCTGF